MKPANLTPGTGRESGSTIVGVLVALIFISIVTASLLKNTASQSAAARGYAAVSGVGMAAAGGIVATESYFAQNPETALGMLDAHILNGSAPYVLGGSGAKVRIADGQFFNSRLVNFKHDDPARLYSQFEIGSGKSAGGKNLKSAQAFYRVENVKIKAESSGEFGGSNAIYLGGHLQDGNNGMEVFGDATFKGGVKLQNKPALFHGTTWISGDLDIPAGLKARFNDKTYVGGSSKFHFSNDPIDTVFRRDAGFGGDINMNGGGLVTGGNVWLNGNVSTMNKNFTSKPHDGAPKSLHTVNGKNISGTGSVDGYTLPAKSNTAYDIPGKLGMSLETRKEPDLDISKIPASLFKPALLGTTAGNNLSTQRLHTVYDSLKGLGELYNDHLVLSVTSGSNINFPASYSPPEFNRKIIFVLEDWAQMNVNGKFYNSSQNASTLMYLKPGASLGQFGCPGLFRGLVYVDPANTSTQSFQWGTGSAIEGAALMKGSGNLYWNSGSGSEPTKITRDNSVLNAFGSLVKGNDNSGGGGAGPKTTALEDGSGTVVLKPIGFYFD